MYEHGTNELIHVGVTIPCSPPEGLSEGDRDFHSYIAHRIPRTENKNPFSYC